MKNLWILFPFTFLVIFLSPGTLLAPEDIQIWQKTGDFRGLIKKDDVVLEKLILCESGGNFKAIGKAGEIGILQYMPQTWELWTDVMGKDLDIDNPEHQIEVYRWAIKNGYAWHWTCWQKLFSKK